MYGLTSLYAWASLLQAGNNYIRIRKISIRGIFKRQQDLSLGHKNINAKPEWCFSSDQQWLNSAVDIVCRSPSCLLSIFGQVYHAIYIFRKERPFLSLLLSKLTMQLIFTRSTSSCWQTCIKLVIDATKQNTNFSTTMRAL